MRVLVTGSRSWSDRGVIRDALSRVAEAYEDVAVISGHCPKGADRIAEQEAAKLGLDLELHPANWVRDGNSAGYVRNAKMADLDIDICLAFIENHSKGSTMMADLAEKRGIATKRFEQQDE